MKKFFIIYPLSFILGLFLIFPKTASAASATLSLTPTTASVAVNATTAVEIHLNTGSQAVNTVKAVLKYGAGQLSTGDSAITVNTATFSVTAQKTIDQGTGTITLTVGQPTPGVNSGDVRVATIVFTGKGAGTGTMSWDASTQVFRDGDSVNIIDVAASKGATITVTGSSTSTGGTSTAGDTGGTTATTTGSGTTGTSGSSGTATSGTQTAQAGAGSTGGGDTGGAKSLPAAGLPQATLILALYGLLLVLLGSYKLISSKRSPG